MRNTQSGLTLVESILIVATIAVIAFVGFALYRADKDVVQTEAPDTSDMTSPREAGVVPEAPEIESADDLDAAEETLQGIDFDEHFQDESELESESEDL